MSLLLLHTAANKDHQRYLFSYGYSLGYAYFKGLISDAGRLTMNLISIAASAPETTSVIIISSNIPLSNNAL